MIFQKLRAPILSFIKNHALPDGGCGSYRYSLAVENPTLYSSAYAVKTRSLFNDISSLSAEERREWAAYFNRYQDEDGLYRDPAIFGEGWYENDPFWCGRPHLTVHIFMALTCLGGVVEKEFALAKEYADPDRVIRWMDSRDWGESISWTGNEVMNLITILQYSRDFHNDPGAGRGVQTIFEWLESHYLNKNSGLWGPIPEPGDSMSLSHAVQAAYHWWGAFLYNRKPIPYLERAIDSLLLTQNPRGGFGWGVHNPEDPYNSSACEDIDSIEPLARFMLLTEYRRTDIIASLKRALPAILTHRTNDNGFSFIGGNPFSYGHESLSAPAGIGAMFPTWFRTLTIAILETALTEAEGSSSSPWGFINCPGQHFPP